MRVLAVLALGASLVGCSSSRSFACNACTSDQDCPGAQSCRLGYCVGPNDDPHRCPAKPTGSSGSVAGSQGSSTSGGSASTSGGTSAAATTSASSSGSSSGSTAGTSASSESGSGSSGGASTNSSASSGSSGSGGVASGSGASSGSGSTSSGASTSTSGSSGTASSSTSGGSGSTGCTSPPHTAAAFIDDLEDGDAKLLPNGGRNGTWFIYGDSAGTSQPPVGGAFTGSPGGADGSCEAARFAGSGFSSYAGVGFTFAEDQYGGGLPYDAGAYSGITFEARSGAGDASLAVIIDDQYGATSQLGGLGASIQLTSAWATYAIPWSQFSGRSQPLDTTQLMTLGFQPTNVSAPFDVWIDNVQFMP